ncbi:hypothetical protein C8J56DRAFT_899377 [Mycena floridula]|nr:hypothetical protein C8J56DRAFT_1119049 [Mycena floridula]KAJ7577306.1 hypothetical protein C8J56DRAFT_899377 [Mycena floridula]
MPDPSDQQPPPADEQQNAETETASTTRKRALQDALEARAQKKGRQSHVPKALEKFLKAARWLVRAISPFLSLTATVTLGLQHDGIWVVGEEQATEPPQEDDTEADEGLSDEEKAAKHAKQLDDEQDELDTKERQIDAYNCLLKAAPDLKKTLIDHAEDFETIYTLLTKVNRFDSVFDMAHNLQMTEASKSAREGDTGKLKEAIPGFLRDNYHANLPGFPNADEDTVPYIPTHKAECGFNNNHYGRLLVPLRMLEKFDEDPAQFCEDVKEGVREDHIVTGDDFPSFMYAEDILCQGELLFQAFETIHFGSSASFRQKRRTKKTVAQINGMTEVTPCLIAYTACQVRFVLSSLLEWADEDGQFSNAAFFDLIIEQFQDGDPVWIKSTLDVWNQRYITPSVTKASPSGSIQVLPGSDREKLRIEKRNRCTALAPTQSGVA